MFKNKFNCILARWMGHYYRPKKAVIKISGWLSTCAYPPFFFDRQSDRPTSLDFWKHLNGFLGGPDENIHLYYQLSKVSTFQSFNFPKFHFPKLQKCQNYLSFYFRIENSRISCNFVSNECQAQFPTVSQNTLNSIFLINQLICKKGPQLIRRSIDQ